MALGIGLELGPAVLRGVVLQRSPQGLVVSAAREIPCETSNPDSLTRALTQARHALRITTPVVLGMPTTSAILTTVSPLIVNDRRARLAVEFELQQQLPFELSQAAWHYRWLPAGNGRARSGLGARGSGRGPQQAVGAVAVAMRRLLLEERLACCRRAGLIVRAVAVNEVAMLGVVARFSALPATGALLNVIDDRTAEWIVWSRASLHVIPIAGPSPETFWQEFEASWDALGRRTAEAAKTIRVVGLAPEASGPGVTWARLHEMLTTRSGLQVEPLDVVRVAGGLNRIEHPERSVAALGLALQGTGFSPLPLNLLEGTQSEAHVQRVRRIAAIASGVCAAAVVAIGLSGMIEVRRRRATLLKTLERQEHLYQTLRPEVRALLQRQQRILQRTQQLERLAGGTALLSRVLAQIANELPDAVWLTTFDCAKTKTNTIEGTLKGRAKSFQDVTQFLDRLKHMAGMTEVKPLSTNVTMDETNKKDVIVFAVQFQQALASK